MPKSSDRNPNAAMSNKVMPMNVDTSANNTINQTLVGVGMNIDQEDDDFAKAFRMAAEQEHRETLIRGGTKFLDDGNNAIKHEASIESEHLEEIGESAPVKQQTKD